MSNDPMGNPPNELLGIHGPDTQLLSNDELHPELPNWREVIRQKVAAFIDATGRIKSMSVTGPPPTSWSLVPTSFFFQKYIGI